MHTTKILLLKELVMCVLILIKKYSKKSSFEVLRSFNEEVIENVWWQKSNSFEF